MAVVLTATEQTAYTPSRVAIVITGLAGTEELVIYREVDGERTTVRGGELTATTATVGLVDHEQPYGVEVTYGVTIDGVDDDTATVTCTLTGSKAILTDAVTGLACAVGVRSLGDKGNGRSSTLFRPAGRNVVVSGEVGQWAGPAVFYTTTAAQLAAMRALLEGATGGITQLRELGTITDIDDYLVLTDWREQRLTGKAGDYRRFWPCTAVQVNAWPSAFETFREVSNLAADPAATSSSVAAGEMGWEALWYGGGGGNGSTTLRTGQVDGPTVYAVGSGKLTTYIRKTWSAAPTDNADTGFVHADGWAGSSTDAYPVNPGEVYTITAYLRASATKTGAIDIYWHAAGGAQTLSADSSTTSLPAGTWTRLQRTVTVPAGMYYMTPASNIRNIGSLWANGNTLDGTGLMVEFGSTAHQYGDGGTPGWEWDDTANASPSSGWDLPL